MSYEGWSDQQYTGNWEEQNKSSYDMANSEFPQEQHFQSFDYSQGNVQQQMQNTPYTQPPTSYTQPPTYFDPGPCLMTPGAEINPMQDPTNMDDEPPLIEELGIDPDAIMLKTLNVLNPLRNTDPSILKDTDLAGPLVFCLAFGAFLLLSGKVHFGYIYGIGLLGCLGLYALINVMSVSGAALGVIVSVLGYCLLPMVALSGINVIFSLQGAVGIVLTAGAIIWCSWSASKLFVTAFSMSHQQPLIAYPCALFYAVFALITIF